MKAKVNPAKIIHSTLTPSQTIYAKSIGVGASSELPGETRWIKEGETLRIPDYSTFTTWNLMIDGILDIGTGSILIEV